MKPMSDEPTGDDEESASSGPNPQEMLEQGKQLCEIGQSIITAAQAMGAKEEPEKDASAEEEPAYDESQDASADYGSDGESSSSPQDLKKNAIIIAIKKRLGSRK